MCNLDLHWLKTLALMTVFVPKDFAVGNRFYDFLFVFDRTDPFKKGASPRGKNLLLPGANSFF